MTDLKKLRELAMTCENDPVDFDNALEIFNSYANPKTILKLLDEVEAAREWRDTYLAYINKNQKPEDDDENWFKHVDAKKRYIEIRKQNEGGE
jgi:hypothetical protein